MIGMPGSIVSWGFDQGNYVRRFAMDIVNLAIKEKGCFLWRYWEARNLSRQGRDLNLELAG